MDAMNLFATAAVAATLNQQTPTTNQPTSSSSTKGSTQFGQTLKTITTITEDLSNLDTETSQVQEMQTSQIASMLQANVIIPTLLETKSESTEPQLQTPVIKAATTIVKETQTTLQSLAGKAQNLQDFLSQLTKDEFGKLMQANQLTEQPVQTKQPTNQTNVEPSTKQNEFANLKTAQELPVQVSQSQTVDAKEIFGDKLIQAQPTDNILPMMQAKTKVEQAVENVKPLTNELVLENTLVTEQVKKPLTKELEQSILNQTQPVDLKQAAQTKPTLEIQNQLTDLTKMPLQTIIQNKTSKDALNLLDEIVKQEEPVFSDKIATLISDPKQTAIQKLIFDKEPIELANLKEVVDQVVEQAKLTQKPGVSEMLLKLKPNNLGEMTIRIIAGDGGTITASFHSNNPEARALLQQSLPAIKQELANTGLKVNDVGVYAGLGDFQSFAQQREGQTNQQNSPKINAAKLALDDQALLEELQAQGENISSDGGVDYRV